MKRFLFICGKNKLRSPTAENIFADYTNIEVRSAGIDNDAEHVVSLEDLEWATHIFLMEKNHKVKLLNKFRKNIKDQRTIVLAIPDKYNYMDPTLVRLLEGRMKDWLQS